MLRRLTPTGLALVEGYKREPHPKLEVFRAANGRPPPHVEDPRIVGIASDVGFPQARAPAAGPDATGAIAGPVASPAETDGPVPGRLAGGRRSVDTSSARGGGGRADTPGDLILEGAQARLARREGMKALGPGPSAARGPSRPRGA